MAFARATHYHQIPGRWGLQREHTANCEFGFSLKGGMTASLHRKYHEKILRPLWPGVQNVVGRKCVFKADSGPGRDEEQFLFDSFQTGFVQYAGLPNGTEIGQECDQVFGEFKSVMEQNRDHLWRAREAAEPGKGQVNFDDLSKIMFGGDVVMVDGTAITLINAVVEGLSKENLRSARLKCGYFPATRAGLKSDRIRHEVVENEDGDVDLEADPLGQMYDNLERDNAAAVRLLIENGYEIASQCRRKINRVTSNMVVGRERIETLPGSQERQELLARCSTAGQHYRITNGGGPVNCEDMIIGRVRQRMAPLAEKKEAQKKAILAFPAIREEAMAVIANPTRHQGNWRVTDLKPIVRFMQGEFLSKRAMMSNP